jgi:hypothetical protein
MAGADCCKRQLYPPLPFTPYNLRMGNTSPDSGNGYVKVCDVADEALALALLELLRSAGIAAVPYPYARGYSGLVFGDTVRFGWGEIVVPSADEEKAAELIGGFLGTMGMLEEAGPDAEV